MRQHGHLTAQPTDFWLARGAILIIVMLQIGIVNDLAVGPRWLAPGLELAILIPLSLATAWTQTRARRASTDAQWTSIGRYRRMVRRLAIVLTAICTLMNFGALARLIVAILAGHAANGKTLSHQRSRLCALVLVAGSRRPRKRNHIGGQKRFPVYPTTSGRRRPRTIQRLVARIYRLPVPCFYKRNGLFTG